MIEDSDHYFTSISGCECHNPGFLVNSLAVIGLWTHVKCFIPLIPHNFINIRRLLHTDERDVKRIDERFIFYT